jgi:iron complex transport system substrate-binding protein
MAVLIKDAGAKYVFADRKQQGSLALSYEEVFLYGKDAEFWIQLSGWKTMDDCIKQDERNKQFKAYQLSNLYNNDALLNIEGGNAYWETGLISPDEILSDLIKIFHQENSIQQQLKYYRRLK